MVISEVFHGKPTAVAQVTGPLRQQNGSYTGSCEDCDVVEYTGSFDAAQKWCSDHDAEFHGE
ncbi:hypothetical protein SEA_DANIELLEIGNACE_94 [Arthrobacter phage DanielleIgnace]|nr:hypothetical protein SEA_DANIELLEIGNACE_94 [Arthrobacter phage DanielleIgnace]